MCTGNNAYAGFYVKKQPAAIHATITTAASSVAPLQAADATEQASQLQATEHKKSLFGRATDFLLKRAKLDQVVYIILSILPLGWLAIGLNDDFEGWRWIVALLLYIIGYIPGLIFSLVMMSKYY